MSGYLSQAEFDQMMEKKREAIAHSETCRHCGKPKVEHYGSNTLFCFSFEERENGDSPPTQKFSPLRPSEKELLDIGLASVVAGPNHSIPSVTPLTSEKLLSESKMISDPVWVKKDPRLKMEMITKDSLADQLAQERKLESRSSQIVTAIGLARMVDELKVENAGLRCSRADSVDKYVATRDREIILQKINGELSDKNKELRTIAAREGETIYHRGRRSMDKWVISAWGAGVCVGAIIYAFLHS